MQRSGRMRKSKQAQSGKKNPIPGLIRQYVTSAYLPKIHRAKIRQIQQLARRSSEIIFELRQIGVSDKFILNELLAHYPLGNREDILIIWPKLKPFNLPPDKVERILGSPSLVDSVEYAIDVMRRRKVPSAKITETLSHFMGGKGFFDYDGLRAHVAIEYDHVKVAPHGFYRGLKGS